MIVIRGQQDNCVKACREILRIMYEDVQIKKRSQLIYYKCFYKEIVILFFFLFFSFLLSDIILKVLANNNFIGRIIGKGGNIINTIKKETDTKFVEIVIHFVLNNFYVSCSKYHCIKYS